MTTTATVATTIRDQISIPTLMGLGAHKLTFYRDALTFNAKVLVGNRPRIVLVKITLTPADLYDLSIGFLNKRTLDWHSIEDMHGIYADTMVETLRKYA